jgi:tetratricopeptide (TPR) repeat protein
VRLVAERLSALGPPRTRAQAEAYSRVAGQASAAGEFETAKALCNATLGAPKTGIMSADSGWVHRASAILRAIDGDIAGTARMQRAAAEAFERAGQKRYAATQRLNEGDSLKEIGDYAAAEITLRAVIVEAGRMAMNVIERYARHNLSMVLARTGRIAEGMELALEAARDADRASHLRGASFAWHYVGLMHLMAGRPRQALEASSRAHASAAPPVRPLVEAGMARAHLALGDSAAALELTTRAMKALDTMGALDEGEGILRLAHAEALHASGDRAAALESILAAKERLVARASSFDEHFRRTFFENVSEHARTLALAAAWSQGK